MQKRISIEVKDELSFIRHIYLLVNKSKYGVVLDSNNYYRKDRNAKYAYHRFDFLAGWTDDPEILSSFDKLENNSGSDWLLGSFSYDLKNELENLSSSNFDGIQMPECLFFCPEIVVYKKEEEWSVEFDADKHKESDIRRQLLDFFQSKDVDLEEFGRVDIVSRVEREEYLRKVEDLLEHIHRGDIFEINYCIEFFAENVSIEPLDVYFQLNEVSPTPFAGYMKLDNKYLLCASPERYLHKYGSKIVSQPIKGTSPRGIDIESDEDSRQYLINNLKERSENIMITDLVRNDLSKVASQSSVRVEELCGVYPFKQVHQMISTISAELKPDMNWVDAIRATFPMGSMTGAPKVRAMQLIEEYESTKRGLYSGSIGYVTPEGDFDFNVIIRSLQYNSANGYLSYMVGSAITAASIPEKEYEECLLKASAIRTVLSGKSND